MEPSAPDGYLARQLGSLALSPVRVANPMPIVRAAGWHNRLLRVGMPLPLFLVHDVGILLTGEGDLTEPSAQLRERIGAREADAYHELLAACADSELARTATHWRIRDDVVTALLARLLRVAWERWGERKLWVGADELPLDPGAYGSTDRVALYEKFDARPLETLVEQLWRTRLQLLTMLEQVDLDTVRLFGIFCHETGGGASMDLADLIHVLASPEANGIVNFSMDLLPSVLEARRQGGVQIFSIDGYASIERRGSVDSIVLSEFAYEEEIFLHKYADDELYYYAHEKQQHEERQLHYLLVDSSASMRGEREVFARGLALTLGKKLALQGNEVVLRFFDSRLYETTRMSGVSAESVLPYLLSFRSERGRNYARVFRQLTLELERARRERVDQEAVIYIITHGQCHIGEEVVAQLKRLARLYGVFILPSSNLHLDYLDLLDRFQIVDAEALASRSRSVDRALEIVGDATEGGR